MRSFSLGETIKIGSNITVKILGIKGNQIRIGVEAPKDVAVHREQIFNRITNEASQPEDA